MDPVIFSFKFIYWTITLRWYGVLVMLGAVVGTWIAEKEIKRRGENGDAIWDALIWVLPLGILGARVWYILNSIAGGSQYYLEDPARMIRITEGGLHFFGGLLFGALGLYIFLKKKGMDWWLYLDAIAPAALIGQALARPANFINQELYGPPTRLPWGISIDALHRLPQYGDLTVYPLETTRFHPTFAYEMILNLLAALLLLWLARQYREQMKPGAIFSAWLVSAGLIRAFIEFFRPDQPRIGETFVTTSMLFSLLMAVAGVVMLLIRFKKIQPAFAANWEEEYFIAEPYEEVEKEKPAPKAKRDEGEAAEEAEEKPARRKPSARKPAAAKTKRAAKKE